MRLPEQGELAFTRKQVSSRCRKRSSVRSARTKSALVLPWRETLLDIESVIHGKEHSPKDDLDGCLTDNPSMTASAMRILPSTSVHSREAVALDRVWMSLQLRERRKMFGQIVSSFGTAYSYLVCLRRQVTCSLHCTPLSTSPPFSQPLLLASSRRGCYTVSTANTT